MMVLQDFEDGLDRWGGALERWPLEARREADALLATSPAARAAHARMAAVEAILAEGSAASGDGARFAAVATRHPQQRAASPLARRAGWGAAVAAALALGLVVGDAGRGVLHEDNPAGVLASALDPSAGAVDVD